jgi:hypothetical protein
MAKALSADEIREKLTAELLDEKKKTNLLRKALKAEREEKLKLFQDSADKIGILEYTIAEKVSPIQNAKIEMLRFEKDDLASEVELVKEVKESESPETPVLRTGRASEIQEQQNKKLLEEVHNLLNENAKLHERLNAMTK